MKAMITIDMDNAAFGDNRTDRGLELARILQGIANKAKQYGISNSGSNKLRDSDGQTVGSFTVTEG